MAAVLFCLGLLSAVVGLTLCALGPSGIMVPVWFGIAGLLFAASWSSNQASHSAPGCEAPEPPISRNSAPGPAESVLQEIQALNDAIPGAAKARIEQMMDTVIVGFEGQLDKLFAGKVLDITSDIQVMQQTLQINGLIPDDLSGASTAKGQNKPAQGRRSGAI